MKKKTVVLLTAMLLVFSAFLAACNSSSGGNGGDPAVMSLVTGGTGGTYFPLGGTFAKQIEDETGITTNSVVSGASAENMVSLQKKEAEIAFTQTDIASYALNGDLMFKDKKVEGIAAIGALYPETIQIVTTADSGIKTVEDLADKVVSVGEPGSGTLANAEQILEVHGLTTEDFDARNLSFADSTTGLQDGTIDAAFITAGTPTGAVEGLAATVDVVIVPVEEAKADELIKKYPYYAKETIPQNTYGVKEDVPTVAVQAMLVTQKDLSEDLVYSITKAIFDNTDQIEHAKGDLIKAENALEGIGIELHPGAEKYFTEKGLK